MYTTTTNITTTWTKKADVGCLIKNNSNLAILYCFSNTTPTLTDDQAYIIDAFDTLNSTVEQPIWCKVLSGTASITLTEFN